MTSAGFAATGKNNYKTNSVLVSASTTIIAVQTLVAIQICRSWLIDRNMLLFVSVDDCGIWYDANLARIWMT